MQMELDLAGANMTEKRVAGHLVPRSIPDFKHFIEETDWDQRFLKQFGKWMDRLCWGAVILSTLFFLQVGLGIILK